MLNEGVELLLSLLILISSSGEPDSDSGREVSDALGPDELVDGGVDSDIFGGHDFLDVIPESSDGSGSSLLERLAEGEL